MIDSWSLWAKTDPTEPTRWHALPWHLLEVGAMAQAMWHQSLSPAVTTRISQQLGITPDEGGRFAGFLAALHDFGKASPRFQSMSTAQVQRLKSRYGSAFSEDSTKTAMRHSLISWKLLVPLFMSEFGWTGRLARRYGEITAAHHGRFWMNSEYTALDGFDAMKRTGELVWNDLHRQMFQQLRDAFGINDSLAARLNAGLTSDPNFPSYEMSLWLAGLISVADWIGSDEAYFPFRADACASYADALTLARLSSEHALKMTGWASPPLLIDSSDLKKTILTVRSFVPRPAQTRAVELTRSMTVPGMTVVEIPMGWGKTEIALWIAAHYAETAGIYGSYFALPTMATSDQLYQRVHAHLEAHVNATKRGRIVPLHVLHGMAELSAMEELPSTAGGQDTMQNVAERLDDQVESDANSQDPVDRSSVVRRARWFTRKKHGLLARYGVGTVDQALMSVLLTPHLFVRLFGLSGKTVIFDEVHSYDVYMSQLFERLLEFLGALGSPVVILSATLPQQRTREMLAAYARGAKWDVPVGPLAAYPRISAIDDTRMQSVPVESQSTDVPSTLHLEWYPSAPETMWDDLADRLESELREGGTVAIICNTVASAQACYLRLAQTFPEEELTLFHARFRQAERARIQHHVLSLFGKDAGKDGRPARPRRHIAVATQVVEQSLDLDFDLMVSMFAPTDLLLQRAGRLQRHRGWDTERPPTFRERPRLWLIGLDDMEADDGPAFSPGSKRVYGDYVLLRSWLALAGRRQIVIPAHVEEVIEATYGPDVRVPEGMRTRYEAAETAWIDDTGMQQLVSQSVLVPDLTQERRETRTDVLVQLWRIKQEPEDAPESHQSRLALTRLGPPTMSLVVLTPNDLEELPFDPVGDETTTFSREETQALLHCAVSVSHHEAVRAANSMPLPTAWARSVHLRHRRLIVLGDDCQASLGAAAIRLDAKLGIMIERVRLDQGEGDTI